MPRRSTLPRCASSCRSCAAKRSASASRAFPATRPMERGASSNRSTRPHGRSRHAPDDPAWVAVILQRERFPLALGVAFAGLVLLVVWSLAIGRFAVAPGDAWHALWSALLGRESGLAANVDAIVLQVRLPRVIAALAVGAALSA